MTDKITIDYRPGEVLRWAHRRFGPVTKAGAGSRRFAYLLGPEANEFVFAHDHLFRVAEAYAGLTPVDGPTSLVVSDGDDHRRRRRLVQPALHHRQVRGYLAIMADNADAVVDRWRPGAMVDAYADFRAAIRRSTLESLFGPGFADRSDQFGADLQPMLDLAAQLPDLISVHRRLRTPLCRRAEEARRRVDAEIYAEIDRVRHAAVDHDHVLATLVHGRDEGGGLSDHEVRDQTVTLIAAGYETTSSAMAWTLYNLGRHPEALQRARAEVADLTADGPRTTEGLQQLIFLTACINETLRLYPPAALAARYAAEEFAFAGRRIAAGTTVIFSPYVTHRLDRLYDQPRDFRPERWLDEHGELRRFPSPAYLPFGGGTHRCVGSTMAITELTVMLARLLARWTFEIPQQSITASGFAAMHPKNGLRVRIGDQP